MHSEWSDNEEEDFGGGQPRRSPRGWAFFVTSLECSMHSLGGVASLSGASTRGSQSLHPGVAVETVCGPECQGCQHCSGRVFPVHPPTVNMSLQARGWGVLSRGWGLSSTQQGRPIGLLGSAAVGVSCLVSHRLAKRVSLAGLQVCSALQ